MTEQSEASTNYAPQFKLTQGSNGVSVIIECADPLMKKDIITAFKIHNTNLVDFFIKQLSDAATELPEEVSAEASEVSDPEFAEVPE